MAAEGIRKWLNRQRRRNCAVSAGLSVLAFGTGVAALSLIFCFFWFVMLAIAPFTGATNRQLSIAWPVGATCAFATLFFIDSLFSRRDDLSNVILWLVRESLGIGPRLLVESGRWGLRAIRFARLDVDWCAKVLAWLAAKRASVSKDEVLKAFPRLTWSRLQAQLRLVQGVMFVRPDRSRVTLTQPLRLYLRRWVKPEPTTHAPPPEPPPVAEPEPTPVTEPERLSPYEILGVSSSASLGEIKFAYRTRIKECHPDRFADLDDASRNLAEEWTKALNAAYATLLDGAKKK
jgi:DnaJ-domain-containing protein 1